MSVIQPRKHVRGTPAWAHILPTQKEVSLISFLQMRELWLRKVRALAQGTGLVAGKPG